MDSKKLHVVVFPWLVHGHISPLLALSKRLAMDDALRVSFVSTPGNISKIRRLVETEQGHIDLVELPLPSVEGLPDGAENTADVPTEIIPLQIKAVDMWEKPFEMLMRKLCPHCVIHDFIQWWTPKVAANLNIPSVVFMMTSGASVAYSARAGGDNVNAEDLMKSPPGYPQSAVRCRLFEALYRLSSYRPKYTTDQIRFMDRFLASFEGSCAIAINSCSQLEGKYLEYLERFTGKPVFPVGPMLVQPPKQKQTTAVLETETPHCLQWLDDRAPRSVVYVSMGSECFPSPAQIHALALGLEASHVPFLWALRFTHNNDNDDVGKRMSAVLPEGFEVEPVTEGL